MRAIALGRRNQITLPKDLIPEGATHFQCEKADDGTIRLIPQITIPASQRYFWSERWRKGEKTASDDIRAGRVRRHLSAGALEKHLDRRRKS